MRKVAFARELKELLESRGLYEVSLDPLYQGWRLNVKLDGELLFKLTIDNPNVGEQK